MKLEFRLLVVDDAPDNIIDGAVGILSDHLELKGFSLNKRFVNDFSEAEFRGLARLEGKDYDLVMVDYRLELRRYGWCRRRSPAKARAPVHRYGLLLFRSSSRVT